MCGLGGDFSGIAERPKTPPHAALITRTMKSAPIMRVGGQLEHSKKAAL